MLGYSLGYTLLLLLSVIGDIKSHGCKTNFFPLLSDHTYLTHIVYPWSFFSLLTVHLRLGLPFGLRPRGIHFSVFLVSDLVLSRWPSLQYPWGLLCRISAIIRTWFSERFSRFSVASNFVSVGYSCFILVRKSSRGIFAPRWPVIFHLGHRRSCQYYAMTFFWFLRPRRHRERA